MCFYEVLGVHSTASPADVKKAYYSKVKKYHPDHNSSPTAEEKFKIIARAYETLKDPTLRRQYDNTKDTTRSASYTTSRSTGYSSSTRYSSSARAHSNFYRAYTNDSDSTYSHQKTWEEYNSKREGQQTKNKYYEKSDYGSANSSFTDGLLFRVSIIVGLFFIYDTWKKEKLKDSLEALQPENLVSIASPRNLEKIEIKDEIRNEMQKKGFRIEYKTVQVDVSPEAREAKKTYKKEKKVIGLENYLETHNLQMQKSQDPFARGY